MDNICYMEYICRPERTALYLLNMHYRDELNIDEGKHVSVVFNLGIILNE